MIPEPKFLDRFEQIRTALRRSQVALGLAATILAAAAGIGVLAWVDFHQELPRPTRAAGLALLGVALGCVVGRWWVAPLRWWTQPRTAAEIEGRFPELGQRIRTVVQYAGQPGDRIAAAGARPGLVAALGAETDARSHPLPLDRIVPWHRVRIVAALAAVPVVSLLIAERQSPAWQVALGRAILIERPYTTIAIDPGDVWVDQGADVEVRVRVLGRPRPILTLETRPAGAAVAAWQARKIAAGTSAKIATVRAPLEYRVVAGPATSPAATIQVRYPLAMRAIEVEVKAPSYTGLDPRTTRGGDVRAVEGSVATFLVTLDGIPTTAALELAGVGRPTPAPGEPPLSPTILPLQRVGEAYAATLTLTRDLDYQVVARTADGRVLPKNRYRVDVVEDRAPRVAFDEPAETMEVHPIAEVRHRVRVADDFGIARAGIVFRFNDGDERTLVVRDFATAPGQKPPTSATLEAVLPLETLPATPRDSVTYHAFVEDNNPGAPRRTETDLRYIDLRPFKRAYKLAGAGPGEEEDSQDLIALDELIARQRVNLNRATRLARHRPTDRTAADDPLKIAGFEETLLQLSQEFTAGIEQLADDTVDSLHKALDAMRAAIDALDRSRTADAPPAMAEALKHLVAARRELVLLISQDSTLAKAMRAFDRRQAQKIRQPRRKADEAEQIADRLEELAREEESISATIATSLEGDPAAPAEPAAPSGTAARTAGSPGLRGDPASPAASGSRSFLDTAPDLARPGDAGDREPRPIDRREVAARQDRLADEVRTLETRFKTLEAASDLARTRLAQVATKVAEVGGALDRGNAREAAGDARVGAGMLRELAREVKGETAREATAELAMARDLADELARRATEFAERTGRPPATSAPGNSPLPGQAAPEGRGGWAALPEPEQIDRMAAMAQTLEAWLRQVDQRGEGKSAEAVRAILDQGTVAEVVERAGRLGAIRTAGNRPDLSKEATELAAKLEAIGQALAQLHQGIVAPRLAALTEYDRRLAELTTRLGTLTTEPEVKAWQRDVAALVHDLDKAGVAGAAELADSLQTDGGWHRDAASGHFIGPPRFLARFEAVAVRIKDRIQDLILKDLVSARDEATPPLYRELVERYYEVISQGSRKR